MLGRTTNLQCSMTPRLGITGKLSWGYTPMAPVLSTPFSSTKRLRVMWKVDEMKAIAPAPGALLLRKVQSLTFAWLSVTSNTPPKL